MKNLIYLLFAFAAISFTISSCSDPCEKVVCDNGTCDGDGNCVCDSLYVKDGDNCVALNTQYVGTYDAIYTCSCGGNSDTIVGVELTASTSSPNELTLTLNQVDECGTITTNDLTLSISENDDVTASNSTTGGTGTGSVLGSQLTFSLDDPGCSFSLNLQ